MSRSEIGRSVGFRRDGFVQDGDEIADCLLAQAAAGHTEGQLIYSLHISDEPECIFTADGFPSPMQVQGGT